MNADDLMRTRGPRQEMTTSQTDVWTSDFGREYTDRNTLDPDELNELYRKNFGIPRQDLNREFLGAIDSALSILEVGCNTGNQLLLLHQMGFSNLSGIEVQPYALEIARSRVPFASLKLGSAHQLPYTDDSFDVVFTSGVLIHIAPQDLPRVLDEIHRCSKTYIWGVEYFAPVETKVPYRGHNALLWKMNYARAYLDRFPDLQLVRERRLPYLENANVDSAFLLKKGRRIVEDR